jgi:hypothetical protein
MSWSNKLFFQIFHFSFVSGGFKFEVQRKGFFSDYVNSH